MTLHCVILLGVTWLYVAPNHTWRYSSPSERPRAKSGTFTQSRTTMWAPSTPRSPRSGSHVRASTGKLGSSWKNRDVRRSFSHSRQRTVPSMGSTEIYGIMKREAPVPSPKRRAKTKAAISNAVQRENFKVVIRIRPPVPREMEGNAVLPKIFHVSNDSRTITLNSGIGDEASSAYGAHKNRFTFDHVYDQFSTQREVYNHTARPAVLSTLHGYNATIFAYGQTGTGKTYTMEGYTSNESRGIIPRAVEEIFGYIMNNASPGARFLVRASYLQIYNEMISDLLKPERSNLPIRENKQKGVFVEGLSEWVVRSPKEVYSLIRRGSQARATGFTQMNSSSSRSHALFVIIIEQNEIIVDEGSEKPRQSFRVGKLNLVDLAGSERVRMSGAEGQRLEESKNINKSLSALGNVISALTEKKKRGHVPYRDSKLTRILEDSLGGNCKTTMMAMISPALVSFTESLSTLKFANRAKNIKNTAHVNEDLDERTLLRKYEKELKRLRHELQMRNKNVVDKRKLIELEEKRRQAEQDKMTALMNMERLSQSLHSEKEAKKKLEEKIRQMNQQLLGVGGLGETAPVHESHAFKTALHEEQTRIRKLYKSKVEELEKEREAMEQDRNQTHRYKQLLLKQRDVMIQLTARLNERDQSIMMLQEELEAYDQHQRMMEDALDQKTATLIHLQKKTMEQSSRHESELTTSTARERGGEVSQKTSDDLGIRDTEDACKTALMYKDKFDDLQSKYNVQMQERTAVCVILEKKMKKLVDRVASSTLSDGSVSQQTKQEIQVLQRLIHASVAALKQSESANVNSEEPNMVQNSEF